MVIVAPKVPLIGLSEQIRDPSKANHELTPTHTRAVGDPPGGSK